MHRLRFRQVHLDFHTSEQIADVGKSFTRRAWREALTIANVDSVTCFAKCHHGWSYFPSKVGHPHPRLHGNLLEKQFDTCKDMNVNVPIYLSAGLDNLAGEEHPEWREISADGRYIGAPPNQPGFFRMCFNSPYLDYLCRQIREVAELFPNADGFFLDIASQRQCCCRWCLEWMGERELDIRDEETRQLCADAAMDRYYRATTAAARSVNQEMPVFHNAGHVRRGDRAFLQHVSHLELESLPTGGWGYDHFPVSARYAINLGLDYLGMTGRFQTTWGEFGGYKHPNALRYECSLMLALGARCSIGEQLHPTGTPDLTSFRLIGGAYAEVEEKEPWCHEVRSVADLAILSSAACNGNRERDNEPDTGCARLLLDGHFLFDVIDPDMDFSLYGVLILPDNVAVGEALKEKLDEYLLNGGRLLLSGTSGMAPGTQEFVWDFGIEHHGQSPYSLDYVLPAPGVQPSYCDSPIVMYAASQRVMIVDAESLGHVCDPYFERDYRHFCSHQHAPPRPEPTVYSSGATDGQIMYLAHPVFTLYARHGQVTLRKHLARCLRLLMLGEQTLSTDLPVNGRVTLMEQPAAQRYVLHLLYAERIVRGSFRGQPLEQIEDLRPLYDVTIGMNLPRVVSRVTLEPQGEELPANIQSTRVEFTVPEVTCHQMVALDYRG